MSVFLSAFRSTATGFIRERSKWFAPFVEPLGVGELAVRAAVEHDDPQPEVVVRVVDRGDLLRAGAAEVADEREAIGECLCAGATATRLQRRNEAQGQHQSQEKCEEPHKRQNVRNDRFVTA
jgi:hypothetical protein